MTVIIHLCQLISDENENLLYKDFEDWQRRKKKKKFVQAVKGKLLFIYLEVGSLTFVDLYSFTKYFSFQGYKMLLLASDWILLGRAIHWLHTSGMLLMRAPIVSRIQSFNQGIN